MRKTILVAAVLALLVTACKKEEKKVEVTTPEGDTTVVVKDETPEAAKPIDTAAMNRAWKDYMTPNDKHKMLADETGSWKTETTMWMSPDAPPEKASGTAEVKMIYGGRYQQSTIKGTTMGQPFEGTSTVGYNNASKKWESTWMDNMGTGMMNLTGDYDEAIKTTNFSGKCTDPMTGQEKTYRETWTIVDANTRKMEMFDKGPDGKEFKSMEMTMTRRK